MRQWTGALGIDQTPDNASLGLPTQLGGYEYKVYAQAGKPARRDGADERPRPRHAGQAGQRASTRAAPIRIRRRSPPTAARSRDPSCQQDWTNTGNVYGPYWAAKFFGLVP